MYKRMKWIGTAGMDKEKRTEKEVLQDVSDGKYLILKMHVSQPNSGQ